MHRESIPMENFIELKLRMFSPVNLSLFTVGAYIIAMHKC